MGVGSKTANLVDALSFRASINDNERQYQEMFGRIKQAGRETLIIKCADLLSNSLFIHLVKDREKQKFLLAKIKYFLALSKRDIGKERVWRDLNRQIRPKRKRLKKKTKRMLA